MQKMPAMGTKWLGTSMAVAASAALVACGGGGGADAPQGTLRLALTDAPACYEKVLVTVEKVRVHGGDAAESDSGWTDIVPPNGPLQVDLLNLTNGALADLGSAQVDAGSYKQLRLVLAENTASAPLANAVQPVGGTLQPLKTPSAQQSGLKIKGDFTVAADTTTDMVLDFDACKSVVVAGASGQYILKPVVTLTPKFATAIEGYVATTLPLNATSVSAQKDGVVVRSTVPDAQGKFVLSYLPSGSYNVVISADARATAVISNVPIEATATPSVVLNGTATAFDPPASAMHSVSGSVTAAAKGNASSPTLVTDATVTATQKVGAATVQVASTPVDFDLATYTFKLPAAAPQLATYASSGLSFSAQAAAAGKYTLQASAPGRATLQKSVDVGAGAATADFTY